MIYFTLNPTQTHHNNRCLPKGPGFEVAGAPTLHVTTLGSDAQISRIIAIIIAIIVAADEAPCWIKNSKNFVHWICSLYFVCSLYSPIIPEIIPSGHVSGINLSGQVIGSAVRNFRDKHKPFEDMLMLSMLLQNVIGTDLKNARERV